MPSIQQILINLSASYPELWRLITGMAYVIGFIMAFRAMYHLKVYGELRTMMASNASLKAPVAYLVVAAVFTFFPTAVQVFIVTGWGASTPLSPLCYGSGDDATGGMGLDAILGFVQIIGLIAFVRGWMLIAAASHHGSNQGFGKGLTHVIGGILAINIIGTRNILWGSFGFSSTWT